MNRRPVDIVFAVLSAILAVLITVDCFIGMFDSWFMLRVILAFPLVYCIAALIPPSIAAPIMRVISSILAVALALFTLLEVNYPRLGPQAQLAIFALIGLLLCFSYFPVHKKLGSNRYVRSFDVVLALGTILCCGYVVVQTEPMFKSCWVDGQSLGNRAGNDVTIDFIYGIFGLLLILEGTRRSIGLAVPILAMVFVAYGYFGQSMPESIGFTVGSVDLRFELQHAGMSSHEIVANTYLQSVGVYGIAMTVMFKYVYLFVIFGAFLEATGGTQFIIDFSRRIFGGSPGGPAKVSVLASGLMGSLSGSAVANAVTTGAFTIPMMRSAGFKPHVAGGITAAAASGGALVPPIMGAGAYMMLDIVQPEGGFIAIMKAAIVPAILYYLSIFLIVHFFAKQTGAAPMEEGEKTPIWKMVLQFEGFIFFGGLITLIGFLTAWFGLGRLVGIEPKSPSVSVTYTLAVIVILGLIHPHKRITPKVALEALTKSARSGVSLIAASACVGIIIGIVTTSGITSEFNSMVAGVVKESLLLALIGIMIVSIILGMGLPSAVCYLLMATLMGSMLENLGVPELAAHLFIFYFGMMSMVTPPVALAAYASASIAEAKIMPTAMAAFRFSLVGFTLPYMFVYRPALLLMNSKGDDLFTTEPLGTASFLFGTAIFTSVIGIVALAAGLTGFFRTNLSLMARIFMFVAATLLLAPNVGGHSVGFVINAVGAVLFAVLATINWGMAARDPSKSSSE